MQKKMVYVLILMTVCVLGITGLQLYWNYQNYRTIIANFKKDADAALELAVDREQLLRRQQIVSMFKGWMADSTIMKITCDTVNREHTTRFTMTDAVPYYANEKADQRTMGLSAFKEKLGKITPAAKAIFINHFAKIVEDDLRDASTYYYTQGLGHRLEKIFADSRLNIPALKIFFEKELRKKKISSAFTLLIKDDKIGHNFLTRKVNAAFKRPYRIENVWASLESPNTYYIREMRWLIISSSLLIGITLFCFYYTIKTLFSQYKLVAIKNQFISNMTHEINTPLASIQVTAESLQQFDHDQQKTKEYLGIILYQTKKLTELTTEILANAKLETLSFPRDEEVNLNEVILRIIDELKPQNAKIIYGAPEGEMILQGNKAHLTRSIANILENAIKYNTSPQPIITIELIKSQREFELLIKDNGIGIADEFKDKIFEQFFRIPTGDVHNIKGYGLGLNYVKKVIFHHKGEILVTDNHPIGTTFTIKLPR